MEYPGSALKNETYADLGYAKLVWTSFAKLVGVLSRFFNIANDTGGKMVEFLTELISKWHIGLQIAIFVVGLALGTFCLVKFCDFFVDSSSVIAKKLKISPLIIGLTIVAMGTSLPELAVSVSDSISNIGGGSAELAIGNVIGSNIANILLVLGFSVVFTPIVVKKSVNRREMPILLGVTVVTVLFVCLFGLGSLTGDFAITRWEGIILVVLIAAYITYLVLMAKKHPEQLDDAETEVAKDMPWWKAIVLLIVGAAGIILGGQFVVFGAKGIAINGAVALGADEGLTKSLVGLTIVAVGTSLPELVTSTIAAKKGQNELALGNVIGSNIFNSLFVLGIAGTVNPLTTNSQVLIDAFFMLGITILLFVFALSGKLRKAHGFVLLGCYALYLTYLVLRTVLGWSI